MELAVKAAGIALVGCILADLLKKSGGQTALLLAAAVCCALTALAAAVLKQITDFTGSVCELAALSAPAVTTVLKTVGIALITRLTCDLCRDAGQTAMSSAAEFVGSAAAVYVSLPLMKTVLDMIGSLL